MPSGRSSHRKSGGFLEALGQWTMGTETTRRNSHRSSHHSSRPHRDTEAYRQARLDNAPPGLNLTARQWREYADHVPAGYCTDEEDGDGGHEDVRRFLPPAPQPEPEPEPVQFRSAWSHSSSSAVTRAHGTVRRRDSPLDRIIGRTSMQRHPTSIPLSRDEVSFDANRDSLFANVSRFEERRGVDDVVVHRERASDDGFMAETLRQPTSETGFEEDNRRGAEVSAQSQRESQLYANHRQTPRIQPEDSNVWPTTQNITHVPIEHSRSRVGSWRKSVVEVPDERYGVNQAPSVFGGSHVTVWPGPDQANSSVSLVPDESASQMVMRHHGRDNRGLSGSRARDLHGSSRTGGSRHNHGRR